MALNSLHRLLTLTTAGIVLPGALDRESEADTQDRKSPGLQPQHWTLDMLPYQYRWGK